MMWICISEASSKLLLKWLWLYKEASKRRSSNNLNSLSRCFQNSFTGSIFWRMISWRKKRPIIATGILTSRGETKSQERLCTMWDLSNTNMGLNNSFLWYKWKVKLLLGLRFYQMTFFTDLYIFPHLSSLC